jgi:predicted DCC family thiol-disulfide oxidoreductase YuxK
MLKVFYDGKCGLCSKEINYYKSIAPPDNFCWFDIATDPRPLKPYNISQADALRRLHVYDASDCAYIGAAAFVVIWSFLPNWRYLAFLMKLPFILSLADYVYNKFADKRFERLKHCQVAEKLSK